MNDRNSDNPYEDFKSDCVKEVSKQSEDTEFTNITNDWLNVANRYKYSYHYEWLGRPIIQYPQDIMAMQEIIWSIKPDLIIETGIAHGGSLIFSASMLELNAMSEGPVDAKVLGIDVDIRKHNRDAIEAHPLYHRISMIEGSSISSDVIEMVKEESKNKNNILVFLDSNHTHEHVYKELIAYAPLVTLGSYCVVFDTVIDDFPKSMFPNRPWGPDDNPKTAVKKYLNEHSEFIVDEYFQNKLKITVAPDGYLKKIK